MRLKVTDAIHDYRRLGSSVDGKLSPKHRTKHYHILSLEALAEAISDPQKPRRFTEERALTNILFDSVRDLLSAEDNTALNLRLQRVTWSEVGKILHQRPARLAQTKQRLMSTLRLGWGLLELEPRDYPSEPVNGRTHL